MKRMYAEKLLVVIALLLALVLTGAACAEANPAYKSVFTDRGILHIDCIFFMEESEAYVIVGDGFIECLEFGYNNDVVSTYRDTVYWPLEGYSAADIANLDSYLRGTYAFVDGLSNASVSYTDINNEFLRHYKLTIDGTDLDTAQGLNALVNSGLLSIDGGEYISMSMTDASLLSQGYIKR